MNIIVLSKTRRTPINLTISRRSILVTVLGLFVVLPLLSGGLGYAFAVVMSSSSVTADAPAVAQVPQQEEVAAAADEARQAVHALTRRLGELQARVIRLDALGKRLVDTAKLDKGEFDFEHPPALGGPEDLAAVESMDVPDFVATLDRLARQLEDREEKLSVIDSLMFNQNLRDQAVPSGKPLQSGGWVSSGFGKRTDPFSGKLAFHAGVDLAGKEGSKVVTVAAGVVTWAGDRFGYGNLVEVDHGNGYVTRYAHNKRNLVKAGDVVKKGQAIALMGSSGRSTGPHVHFELLHNGRQVDPASFLRAAR